uniref:Ovule protein n=1 Tax=Heterorhabditis bacteriophora TaxID=37862 RepID=A0A1I7XGT3_HETBA
MCKTNLYNSFALDFQTPSAGLRYESDSSHHGVGYYDECDERKSDSRPHNWRYDSIQEEDHEKTDIWREESALENWSDKTDDRHGIEWRNKEQRREEECYGGGGYQADREDSSRQNSVERSEAALIQSTDIA